MELRKFQTLSQGQLLISNWGESLEKMCFFRTIHMGDFVEVNYFKPDESRLYTFHKPDDLRLPYNCADLSNLQVGQEVIVLSKFNEIEIAKIIEPIQPNDYEVFLISLTGKTFYSDPQYISII